MTTAKTLPKASSSPPLAANSKASEVGVPVWIRLGIPLGCACLAAVLNFAAVKRQIRPVKAYAISEDLPMGTLLRASHLTLIDLAGNFDRSRVFLENDLLIRDGGDGRLLSLQASLEREPRVLTRESYRGEILVQSTVGGIEGARKGEGLMEVPRSMIESSDNFLTPGKTIYFSLGERGKPGRKLIGPFRIALKDIHFKEEEKVNHRDEMILIAYRLTDKGMSSPSAAALEDAITNKLEFTLAVREIRPASNQGTGDTAKDVSRQVSNEKESSQEQI